MVEPLPRSDRDVAVVGLAIGAPTGFTPAAYWTALAEGADLIKPAPPDIIEPFYFGAKDNSRMDRFYNQMGAFSDRILTDPLRYGILPIAAEGSDPDMLVALMLADYAMEDAGLLEKKTPLQNACCIIGRGQFATLPQLICSEVVRQAESLTHILRSALPLLPEEEIEAIKRDYQSRFGRYAGDTVTSTMPSLAASGVAHRYDMHGPAYLVDGACASGIIALEHGIRLLHSEECDIAVIGALHTSQSAVFWSLFNAMGAMSHKGQIAPFSKDADGLVIGQGAGFCVLKTLDRAEHDGDRIYAVIKATATGSDGAGTNALVTNPQGQRRVLDMAWRRSGLDPEQVGYVETHGTATPIGDANEIQTLTTFFGDSSHPKAYLGSVKSNIGHTMPAAGMFGLLKTILSLHHRQIPPTLHCEEPLSAMARSRFEPAQELIDWQSDGLPLVAGVNAFGFGGANAHAVLTAYQEPAAQARRYRVDKRRLTMPDVIAVAGPSQESLFGIVDAQRLQAKLTTITGTFDDPYRIVVFNPTAERLALAARIVEQGKPWRGRSDIWFTNKPALQAGGKVAFMFPGYNLSGDSEHESIEDELGVPYSDFVPVDERERQAAGHYHMTQLMHEALLKTGIKPDLYTGHSVGEWFAARSMGVLDESFDKVILEFSRDPELQVDDQYVLDYHLVAINSKLTPETREALFRVPDVLLSNDNCPTQIVVSVLGPSLPQLRAVLDADHVFYTVLPFASPLHTPYIESVLDTMLLGMKDVSLHRSDVPLWSPSSLSDVAVPAGAELPTEQELHDHYAREIRDPVLWRQLVEKLYDDEGARVFVQVGPGPLHGFVEDTLKGRDFSSVSSVMPGRTSLDQLRRVHAALFTEGCPGADLEFMGMRKEFRQARSVYVVPSGAPLLQRLESLDEAVEKHYGPAAKNEAITGFANLEGVPSGIVQTLDDNLRQAVALQGEIVQRFKDRGLLHGTGPGRTGGAGPRPSRPLDAPSPAQPALAPAGVAASGPGAEPGASGPADPESGRQRRRLDLTQMRASAKRAEGLKWQSTERLGEEIDWSGDRSRLTCTLEEGEARLATMRRQASRKGKRIDVPVRWTLEDYPTTIDHSIINQPLGWSDRFPDEVYPVVPLTMSLELMAELVLRQIPDGLHVVKIGPVTAMNFINLTQPFEAMVRCHWKQEETVSLTVEGYLMLDVTVAAEYPAPPPNRFEELLEATGPDIGVALDTDWSYENLTFHRAAYRSCLDMYHNGEHGYASLARSGLGKASLLDQAGQAIGLFLHYRVPDRRISFPVRVTAIEYYQDMFDQSGTFDSVLFVRGLTDNFITGDGALRRDGKLWGSFRGWINQRLPFDQDLWNVMMHPHRYTLAEEIAPGVMYHVNEIPFQQSTIFMA
ncbi:MAG: acyltransferase domain-containing protein, partial [Propionibacteriaceae bacterium]|nr:acyltransferase domain-containing protein [Propionibacteriaceae bacterium]